MKIAINGNRHQEGQFDRIDRLVSALVRRGDHVVMAEPFFNYLTANLGDRFGLGIDYMPLSRHPEADLAISIGGDGAFLKTARWVGDSPTPVAGINTGHLGYLSAFTFENPREIEDILMQGKYRIEERAAISVEVVPTPGNPQSGIMQPGILQPAESRTFTALNEIAITRADTPAMLNVAATINSNSAIHYVGDGLIIATPTGSTAYSLSVGGPILDPSLAGWVLAPIAAHSLSMRPMVVGDSSVIDIAVETRGTAYRLAADGRAVTLPLEARLRITRAPRPVRIAMHPGHSFTDTLRDKLGLGAKR